MKSAKTAILLTAFLSTILSFSFGPVFADSDYVFRNQKGDPVNLPNRLVIPVKKPGIWQHVAARHQVEIKSKTRKLGLETVRFITFRLPEPVRADQKDKITQLYVLDKDGLIIGAHEFAVGEQEYVLKISGVINYVQIYLECASHGLWQQDLRFVS